MDGLMDFLDGRMDVLMDGWMDVLMDGWMDGWMDGCFFWCNSPGHLV